MLRNSAVKQNSSDEFRLLVQSVADYAIFMLDTAGHVQTWNTGAQLIKGYRAEEIVGQHFSVFFPEVDRKQGKPNHLLCAAEREGRVGDEGWCLRKDGSRFFADVVITAVRDETGTLRGFAKVTRDLTERRRVDANLYRSEERFRLLVESVKDYAIFILDPDGCVATWNVGAERIKGYSAREIIGQHFSVFYEPEEVKAGKCETELKAAVADGRFEDEGWRLRKDGSRFWANVIITALFDETGELRGFAKVTRDLTLRRAAEQERLRLAEAQAAVRARDEFLSIASHELRTPLSALLLQLQAVLETLDASEPQRTADRIRRAACSATRLHHLLESLLDVSRIATDTFTLNLEEFDLTQAIEELVEELRPSALQARCELSLSLKSRIVGKWDRLRIEQAIMNLLANAFKYASGARVCVRVAREEKWALISVRDSGPGIPEKDLSRVFGRFERAGSSRRYGGMGLGLYLAREIAEGHGGSISAENGSSGGLRVLLRLPL
jgi:PAS domain S-box-containing protein